MGRRCSICDHTDREGVETALSDGRESNRRIAARFAISEQALRRHREHLSTPKTFIGRRSELAELTSGLDDARRGQGGLCLISGEAGIGKTRLAEEFADHARQRGALVVWGRCWETDVAPPYWPWALALRGLFNQVPSLSEKAPARRTLLSGVVPGLDDVSRVDRFGTPDAQAGSPFALYEAITSVLRDGAADRPLALIFDDLHAADRASALLLQFALRDLRDAPVFIAATYRPGDVKRSPALAIELGNLVHDARSLPLAPFVASEIGELVDALGGEPEPGLVDRLYATTDGNPFFVTEIIRTLATQGPRHDTSRVAGDAASIPESVRATVLQRVDATSDACRRLLNAGAVLGREFDELIAARAIGLTPEERGVALDEATAGSLIDALSEEASRFRFSHALVRDVIYEDLSPAQRVIHHRRVAETIESLHAGDIDEHLDELAHHYFQTATAGGAEEAVAFSIRAGDRAMSLPAPEDAVVHYERALQALDACEPDDRRRCAILIALSKAYRLASEAPKANDCARRAAKIARRIGDANLWSEAVLVETREVWFGVVDEDLIAQLEALSEALGEQDSPEKAHVLAGLAQNLQWSDDRERAEELGNCAVEMARRCGDPSIVATALVQKHEAVWGPQSASERLNDMRELLLCARETGSKRYVLYAHTGLLWSHLELGHADELDRALETLQTFAKRYGYRSHLFQAALVRAMRTLHRGRLVDAEQQINDALTTGEWAREPEAARNWSIQIAVLRREQGRLGELEPAFREYAERYPRVPAWRCALALAAFELGRMDDARAELDRIAADGFAQLQPDVTYTLALAMLAEVCHALGDADRARAIYDRLLPYDGRLVVIGYGHACYGAVAMSLGLAAATMSRLDDAERHFIDAIDLDVRMGARPSAARSQRELAAVLIERGQGEDVDRARVLLADAHVTFSSLGMDHFAELTARQLTSIGMEGAETPQTTQARLRREIDRWILIHGDNEYALKHASGLTYVAHLVAHPGREFHVLDLVATTNGHDATGGPRGVRAWIGDAGSILDPEAKRAYKRRLDDLNEDLEDARVWGDADRAGAIQEEIDAISKELATAVGLGGRDRKAASASERARINVSRTIRAAVKRIEELDPLLGRSLDEAIRTGTFCAYLPGPQPAVDWAV
jgi:tetratricopeptide (TPR) repeat protein